MIGKIEKYLIKILQKEENLTKKLTTKLTRKKADKLIYPVPLSFLEKSQMIILDEKFRFRKIKVERTSLTTILKTALR